MPSLNFFTSCFKENPKESKTNISWVSEIKTALKVPVSSSDKIDPLVQQYLEVVLQLEQYLLRDKLLLAVGAQSHNSLNCNGYSAAGQRQLVSLISEPGIATHSKENSVVTMRNETIKTIISEYIQTSETRERNMRGVDGITPFDKRVPDLDLLRGVTRLVLADQKREAAEAAQTQLSPRRP